MAQALSDAEPLKHVVSSARSRFFVDIAVLMIILVVAGFWPYYGRVVSGAPLPATSQHWMIHVHQTLFIGWMLLFAVQAGLVWRRRIDLHRFVGPLAAGYGSLISVVGLYAAVMLPVRRIEMGMPLDQAAAFLFTSLTDILMFVVFLAAAIAYRKEPAFHRALMFLATLSLAIVGETRLVGQLLLPLLPELLARLVVLLPLFLIMGHELLVRRRVHPIYVVGGVLFFFRFDRPRFGSSERDCECGCPGCWPLLCRIEVSGDVVAWRDFEQPHRGPTSKASFWDYSALEGFTFSKQQYFAALSAVRHDA